MSFSALSLFIDIEQTKHGCKPCVIVTMFQTTLDLKCNTSTNVIVIHLLYNAGFSCRGVHNIWSDHPRGDSADLDL